MTPTQCVRVESHGSIALIQGDVWTARTRAHKHKAGRAFRRAPRNPYAVCTSLKLRVSVMAAVGDANAMISVAFTTTAEVSVLGLNLWPGATLSNGDVGK